MGLNCLHRTHPKPRKWTLEPYSEACPSKSKVFEHRLSSHLFRPCMNLRALLCQTCDDLITCYHSLLSTVVTNHVTSIHDMHEYHLTFKNVSRYVRMKADKDMFIIMQLIQVHWIKNDRKHVRVCKRSVFRNSSKVFYH